jgi:Coenzyme PQQ synthesis protein D (PqqD)
MTTVSLHDGVTLRPDVAFRTIDDEGVVLDLATGTYFGLNASGTRMWQLLAEHGSLRKVAAALAREFDARPATLERDLLAFVEHLASRDLIRVVPREGMSRRRP